MQEAVYFIRSENKAKGVKSDTKRVPWKERYTFHEDGYRMLGVSTGVKKVTDAKGNEVNERKTLAPYDACEEIGAVSYTHLWLCPAPLFSSCQVEYIFFTVPKIVL